MDRWGPSIDCEICGLPVSFGHLIYCPDCGKNLCRKCYGEHNCEDYWDEKAQAVHKAKTTGNHRDLQAYLKLRSA